MSFDDLILLLGLHHNLPTYSLVALQVPNGKSPIS